MRRRLISLGELPAVRRQWRNGGCNTHPVNQGFPGETGEYGGENAERQHDKENREEKPADEKFPCAVGIKAKAQEQQAELRQNESFTGEPPNTVVRDGHELEERSP